MLRMNIGVPSLTLGNGVSKPVYMSTNNIVPVYVPVAIIYNHLMNGRHGELKWRVRVRTRCCAPVNNQCGIRNSQWDVQPTSPSLLLDTWTDHHSRD